MSKRDYTTGSVTRNAVMAVLQVIVSGGALFFLYRYLLRTIGAEQVGIWAIILATVSASRISEMGFTGSAVKYTAKYIARNDRSSAAAVIQTTAISIALLLLCVLLGGYWLLAALTARIIPAAHVITALEMLPYALASVWIGAIGGVFVSGLDGCNRIDLRVLLSMATTVSLLVFSWLLVPEFGLMGLAWAQVLQGLLLTVGSWLLLRRELPSLPFLPIYWRYSLLREMLAYGVNFQISSVFAMLFDPTTKALMAKFGGLSSTAYYEMANRMVMQFRSLLVSANQVMVPQVANLDEIAPDNIRQAYLDAYGLVFFLALPLYSGIVAIAPIASELWIGIYEPRFVTYTILLSIGFWLNNLVGPAYFVSLGTGMLQWNTLSHVVIGVLNVALGYFLGSAIGGTGVVMGYVFALVIGSGFVVFGYLRDQQIPISSLVPDESKPLFLSCAGGLASGYAAIYFFEMSAIAAETTILGVAISTIAIAPVFWRHPLRAALSRQIIAAFATRAEEK